MRTFFLLGLLILAACGTSPPAPVEERGRTATPAQAHDAAPGGVAQPDLYEQPARAVPLEDPGRSDSGPGPAIVALLDESDRKLESGNSEAAAAAIERALRIEPSDPYLWHRLAGVRLRQGRLDEAESLAARSISLAAGSPSLLSANWTLIAQARDAGGNAQGAAEARMRARGPVTP